MTKLDEIRKRIEASDTNTNPLYPYSGSFEQVSEDIHWLLNTIAIVLAQLDSLKRNIEMEILSNTKAVYKGPAVMDMNNIITEKLKISVEALQEVAEARGYIKGEEPGECAIAREALSKIRGEG